MNQQSHLSPDRVRNSIRYGYRSLRGVDINGILQQLDAYHAGFIREAVLTWETIEHRDLYLRNVALKRKKAVARNGWEILTLEQSPEALRQKAALEFFYNHITVTHALDRNECGGLSLLIRQMMDAVGKGHAVHEILWDPNPAATAAQAIPLEDPATGSTPGKGEQVFPVRLTAEFRFVPLWFFENTTGQLRFLESEGALYGTALEEDGWLITTGDGIMEPCSIAYALKSRPLSNWGNYCDWFSQPGMLGKTSSARGSAEWKAVEEALGAIVNGKYGIVNVGDSIEIIEPSGSGNLPFPDLVDYLDRAMASLWRGSDLSTLSRRNAVGATLQEDETITLLEDDAQLISETLNLQVDRAVLRYLFGEEAPRLAYIRILAPQRQNIDQDLRIDDFLTRIGVALPVNDLLERYGRPQPDADERLTSTAQADPAGGEARSAA